MLFTTLQSWIFDMPGSEPSVNKIAEFGPCKMTLHWEFRDLNDECGHLRLKRRVVVIETVEVEAEYRGRGWFRRALNLLAVMCPVDYILVECVTNVRLGRYFRNENWLRIDNEESSPDYYKDPRRILGLVPRIYDRL